MASRTHRGSPHPSTRARRRPPKQTRGRCLQEGERKFLNLSSPHLPSSRTIQPNRLTVMGFCVIPFLQDCRCPVGASALSSYFHGQEGRSRQKCETGAELHDSRKGMRGSDLSWQRRAESGISWHSRNRCHAKRKKRYPLHI